MTYLQFTETRDIGKTKVWRVENSNDGSFLGVIRWHGAWRKYVLDVMPDCIWSEDCLGDVTRFIGARMEERRVAAAAARQAKKVSQDDPG